MSGAPWNFEHWNTGEPNQNGNEDCGAFDSQAEGFGVNILIDKLQVFLVSLSTLVPFSSTNKPGCT